MLRFNARISPMSPAETVNKCFEYFIRASLVPFDLFVTAYCLLRRETQQVAIMTRKTFLACGRVCRPKRTLMAGLTYLTHQFRNDAPRRGARKVARCGARSATRLVGEIRQIAHAEGVL